MHNSNTNNHLFLKAFMLFLIVFVFSASNDFKKRSNDETNQEIGLCIESKQQANAVLVSLPKLPPVKANCSFGNENDFLFKKPSFVLETCTAQKTKNKLKLLSLNYLNLKKRLKTQSFFTITLRKTTIPGFYSA